MFAVIKTGGKQYRVATDDQITIMSMPGVPGEVLAFDQVLSFHKDGVTEIGQPFLEGMTVAGEIVQQKRSPKTIAFKKRRRQNSKRKRGHRQELTVVRITEFLTGGSKPAARAHAAAMVEPVAAATHDSAGIAAAAMASVAAAKAAGIDTGTFRKLDAAVGTADDLELISGVGPGIAKKLHDIGIYHFWQVAAMSQADIDAVEHEVGFKGRAVRDHWKDQAQELMEGKGPRAKVDQARATAKHD